MGDSFVVAEPEGMPVGTRVDLNPPREKEEVEGAIPLHLSASSPPFRTVPTEEEGEGEGFVPQRPGMDGEWFRVVGIQEVELTRGGRRTDTSEEVSGGREEGHAC